MKQILGKRTLWLSLGCAFLVAATGCGGSASSSSVQPSPMPTDAMEETKLPEDRYEKLKMGLGIVVSHHADGMAEEGVTSASGKVAHTAVGVLLEDDVICGSLLDEHESDVSAVDGGLALPTEVQSKREKGEAYGMRSYSDIGKEWYEQADAFCHYIQGMTSEEVMNIPVDENGKATEADLAAGCTISIEGFQQAVQQACDNAKLVNEMDIEDYTNYKNEGDGIWGDLVDGTEDVLDGVVDGAEDLMDGKGSAENSTAADSRVYQ